MPERRARKLLKLLSAVMHWRVDRGWQSLQVRVIRRMWTHSSMGHQPQLDRFLLSDGVIAEMLGEHFAQKLVLLNCSGIDDGVA